MDFSHLDSFLKKVHPVPSVISNADALEVTDWIDSGNLMLNMLLSGSFEQGYANNKIYAFAGESGAGKTYFLMTVFKSLLDKGYTIYHFETEGAVDNQMLKNYGLWDYYEGNPNSKTKNKLKWYPTNKVEELTHMVVGMIDILLEKYNSGEDIGKIAFACDSLGNLTSNKSYEDSKKGNNKQDFTPQKRLAEFFRNITINLNILKIPFFFTNHTYDSLDMFSPGQKMSKGNALLYNASVVLMMSKKAEKDENAGKKQTGIIVTVKSLKNRLVGSSQIKVHISFKKGINRYFGLQEYIKGLASSQSSSRKLDTCGWDECGIGRGKLAPIIKEVPMKDDDDNIITYKSGSKAGQPKMMKVETGEYEFIDRGTAYCVEHLGESFIKKDFWRMFFTNKIWTDKQISRIEPHIKEHFAFGNIEDELIDDETID